MRAARSTCAGTTARAAVLLPINKFLSDKWDDRLYNWSLWLDAGGSDRSSDGVSSIYDPSTWQRGSGYRSGGTGLISGEAEDTNCMLLTIQTDSKAGGDRIYKALEAWAKNYGSRGSQAARLATSEDSYYDWVDSGKRWLERLDRSRKKPGK